MKQSKVVLAVLLAALIAAPAVSAPTVAASQPQTPNYKIPIHGRGQFVTTAHGRLYFEVEGKGPPVILISGGPGGSHASFHPWFSRLAGRFTVIYFDNIGRGRSDRLLPGTPYTVERDAEDVEALRSHLKLNRIHLIGHSYGGFVAQAYALTHPDRVGRLVLSSTSHGAASFQENIDNSNHHTRHQYPEIWDRLMALRARDMTSAAKEYADLYDEAEGDLLWYSTDAAKRVFRSGQDVDAFNRDVYLAMLGNDPEWVVGGTIAGLEFRPRLAQLRMPVLICVGRFDRITTPKMARELEASLPAPTTRLIVFERSGHRPWLEEADRYFGEVQRFLAARCRRDERADEPQVIHRQAGGNGNDLTELQ
jgi:proline iminopeptidase